MLNVDDFADLIEDVSCSLACDLIDRHVVVDTIPNFERVHAIMRQRLRHELYKFLENYQQVNSAPDPTSDV